jgi:DNA polymerase-3 subunit delta'
MGQEPANHFLKTLEEPPTDVTFFLLTARLPALLETIVSRCQIVRMHRAPAEEIEEYMLVRGYPADKAKLYASLSDGCAGRAVNMEETGIFERRADVLQRLLNVTADNRDMLASEMLAKNRAKTLTVTRDNHSTDLGLMAALVRDMAFLAEGADSSLLYNPDVAGDLQPRASQYRPEHLRKHTVHILEARRNIESFINPDLVITQLFIELSR